MGMKKYLLDEIMKLAIESLEMKKTTENTKILEDVLGVIDLLEKGEYSILNPIMVDYRLRKEYDIIEQMEKLLPSDNSFSNGIKRNWHSDICGRLQNDLASICINVLIEHCKYQECRKIMQENKQMYYLLQ